MSLGLMTAFAARRRAHVSELHQGVVSLSPHAFLLRQKMVASHLSGFARRLASVRSFFTAWILIALSGSTAMAEIVGDSSIRSMLEINTYEKYGGGDVMFRLNPAVPGCEGGFWLTPADVGFKTTLASLPIAYTSKSGLRARGYTDQLWAGSSDPTCKLYSIGITN